MRELSELSIVLKNTRVIRGNDLYNTWNEDENGVGLWTHAIMVDKETHYRMELFEPYWSDTLDVQIDTFAHELYHGTEDNIKKKKMEDDKGNEINYFKRPHDIDAKEKAEKYAKRYGALIKKHLKIRRVCKI